MKVGSTIDYFSIPRNFVDESTLKKLAGKMNHREERNKVINVEVKGVI